MIEAGIHRRRRTAFGAVAALLALASSALASPALAAPESDRDKFGTFLHSDQHRQLVDSALSLLPPEVYRHCPALVVGALNIQVRQHIVFGTNDIPTAGMWVERAPVSGCGNDVLLNVYFGFDRSGRLRTITGFPGTTHADLLLQRDAGPYAIHQAQARFPACRTFVILNTRFDGYGTAHTPRPAPGAKDLSWQERWTLGGCGRRIEIPIHFTPNHGGTSMRP